MESNRYMEFLQKKNILLERQKMLYVEIAQIEKELDMLAKNYTPCDHPSRILTFPVCGVCYKHVPK
jgi:hypothetical protein